MVRSRLASCIYRGAALQGELVIDAHTHLGVFKDYFIPKADAQDLVAYMDRFGISKACTFAFAGVNSDFRYGNDLVAQACRDYPSRFIGYVTLNANYPEELVEELERGERLGLQGIKLITAYQGHPEETERFYPVYEWANARRKIILSHQWGRPEYLSELARRYPQVSFHIGHLNFAYAPVVRRHDSVFTTTTFVPWPGAIERAVREFGAEKLLFGSDFPDLDASLNLGPLLTAEISDEAKRLILGRNMERILKEHAGGNVR
jgi:predicted TIM-barrel fold metal-dependent hydrolase